MQKGIMDIQERKKSCLKCLWLYVGLRMPVEDYKYIFIHLLDPTSQSNLVKVTGHKGY